MLNNWIEGWFYYRVALEYQFAKAQTLGKPRVNTLYSMTASFEGETNPDFSVDFYVTYRDSVAFELNYERQTSRDLVEEQFVLKFFCSYESYCCRKV